MKKIIALVLALALCFALGACGTTTEETATEGATDAAAVSSDLDYITGNGKMVIGYTVYEPMNYFDEDNNLTGFDTEFAEAVCAALGVEPEFIEIDWDNKFLALDSKTIDCIWNGMTITEEALLNASVTDPYVKNAQVVVMSSDKAAEVSLDDLSTLSYAAEAGSAGAAAIEENYSEASLVEVAAQTDALLEVMAGSVDACVIDLTMANAMTGEGTSYDSLTKVTELSSEEYGIAFRADSDVTEVVNGIIADLMEDGTLAALAEKYELALAE